MIKFGTDGWRAVISQEFTFDNVARVAQAIAAYLKHDLKSSRPVIIGYDARFLADQFAILCAKVLKTNGLHCYLTETDTPTPVVAFEVKDKGAAGAIMITASHNPPEYCGIKFIADYAGPIFEDVTRKIEGYLAPLVAQAWVMPKGGGGEIERFEPKRRYLRFLEGLVDVETIKRSKLKVVFNPMFGSGRGYLDEELDSLGVTVEVINNYRDVLFGGHSPEPGAENLKDLSERVLALRYDVGLANDGDADRFGVIDETGRFLNANQVVALLSYYLLKEKKMKGNLVRSVATSHLFDAIAAKFKVKCIEVPVGFKHVAKKMLAGGVLLGGEESGGLSIAGHIPEKDGILAGLLVVEMLAKMKKPLSQIFKQMEDEIGVFVQERINLVVPAHKKDKIIADLKEHPPAAIDGQAVQKVTTIDGVKIVLADGSWFLVRPSGTEPLVRVYLEASSEQKLQELKRELTQRFITEE